MKTYTPYSLLLAAIAASGMAFGAETAYTTPVGYTTIPLPGTGGLTPQRLQVASQGLLPGDAIQFAGNIESYGSDGGGTFVQDTQGTWAAGDYTNTTVTPAIRSSLVQITSGPLVGTFTWITATAANKIYTYDDISAAGAGATYRVVKAFTISSLLGTVPAATVLGGGGNIGAADNFLIFNSTANTYETFWYKSSGVGGTGWRSDNGATLNPALVAIHPNDSGLVFVRKQSGDGSLVVAGSVITGENDIFVKGGTGTVLNILSLLLPVDQVTPLNSGLYTGNATTGLLGGGNIGAADNVLIFDAATNTYKTFWYKSSGVGGTGWRSDDGAIADPGNYKFPAQSAVLIQRKNGASFTWHNPSVVVSQ